MKNLKLTLFEKLYEKHFDENLHISSNDKSELEKQGTLFIGEEEKIDKFFSKLSEVNPKPISYKFIRSCHDDLFKEIRTIEKESATSHSTNSFTNILSSLLEKTKSIFLQPRLSYGFSFVVVCCMFGVGYLIAQKMSQSNQIAENAFLPGTEITQVHFIKNPANQSKQIEMVAHAVTPIKIEGEADDKFLTQTISSALQNSTNAASKLDCIETIASHEVLLLDQGIRDALFHALQYDNNPEVRMKSMYVLAKNFKSRRTQRALIHTMQNDENNSIRTVAARIFSDSMTESKKTSEPIKLDADVLKTLSSSMETEPNRFIKEKISEIVYTEK